MTDIDPIPEHGQSVVTSLVIDGCADAIDWYVRVFGAREVAPRMTGPDGTVAHAEIDIGGSLIFLGDEWPDGPITSPTSLGGSPFALFVYSGDADEVWQRALDAGADVVFPYEKQFYGHMGGRIRDPWGHMWGIGKVVEVVDDAEMAKRMQGFYDEQDD